MIELIVEPRVSKSWDEFLAQNPPFSIALDGYVQAPPAFSEDGPHANFDHHVGVDRLGTRSTCMQVTLAIIMGLFDRFQVNGEPKAILYVNDPDPDVCLSVWLLRNPGKIAQLRLEQELGLLLLGEDIMDSTGGAIPVRNHRRAAQLAWVFAPYFEARLAGRLHRLDAKATEALIDEVGERITRHANGDGESVEIDVSYDELGGGDRWRLIREHGSFSRSALFAEGIRAFVAVRERSDGGWTYSIGRMSSFVRFPLERLYESLNAAEGIEAGETGWGGSNTIGGSPRQEGSRLSPAEVERIINSVLGEP